MLRGIESSNDFNKDFTFNAASLYQWWAPGINMDEGGVSEIRMGLLVITAKVKGLAYQIVSNPLGDGSMRHGQVLEVNGKKTIGQVEEFPKVNITKTAWLIVLNHSSWYNSYE
ncbi:unnamed protein product [Eruca vesicaria subsp. sativa]|uniref:Uncharacterized protein n=1 Tax=Eruca vesicaria subsp. sativa TaxID=29727 RepID=A0ABC8K6X8_ERUVS|nr:unnamed protein product [Eruca vesicaria subsp. sativa]